MLLYQILACTIRAKVKKCHEKKTNLENQLRHGINILNCLMDYILYPILNTLDYISKKRKQVTKNPSIKVHVEKIKTFNYA